MKKSSQIQRIWRRLGIFLLVVAIAGVFLSLAIPNIQEANKGKAVRANAHAMQQAVELFKLDSDGRIPSNIDKDRSDKGKTVMDYLGYNPANPYTGVTKSAINGEHPSEGQISYQPRKEGYIVLGAGRRGEIIFRYNGK